MQRPAVGWRPRRRSSGAAGSNIPSSSLASSSSVQQPLQEEEEREVPQLLVVVLLDVHLAVGSVVGMTWEPCDSSSVVAFDCTVVVYVVREVPACVVGG